MKKYFFPAILLFSIIGTEVKAVPTFEENELTLKNTTSHVSRVLKQDDEEKVSTSQSQVGKAVKHLAGKFTRNLRILGPWLLVGAAVACLPILSATFTEDCDARIAHVGLRYNEGNGRGIGLCRLISYMVDNLGLSDDTAWVVYDDIVEQTIERDSLCK